MTVRWRNGSGARLILACALIPLTLPAAEDCLTPAPRTAAQHVRGAECFSAKGDWRSAEEHLRTARRLNPESERAATLHAQALVHLGQPFDAVLEIEKFLESHPDAPAVLKVYAALQERVVRDVRKADEILVRLSKLTPADPEVWRTMGLHNLSRGAPEEALRCFKEAVRLAPADPIGAVGLGAAHLALQQDKEADAQFERAVQLNERGGKPQAVIYSMLAEYLLQAERAEQAAGMAGKALALEPRSGNNYYWRGAAYERLGRYREAEADARAALREGGHDQKRVHLLLARIYRATGDQEGAARASAEVKRLSDLETTEFERAREVRAALRQAEPMLREGRFAEAAPLYERIVGALPTFYEAYFALGLCYSQTGRPADSEAAFRKYLSLQPLSADGRAALGVLLANVGRTAEAKKELAEAIRLDGGQIEVRRLLGHLHSLDSEHALAVRVLRPGLRSSEADSAYRLAYAEALLASGDKAAAAAEIEGVLKAEPGNAGARDLRRRLAGR